MPLISQQNQSTLKSGDRRFAVGRGYKTIGNVRKKARKNQSMSDLHYLADAAKTNNEAKERHTLFGRRLPRWLHMSKTNTNQSSVCWQQQHDQKHKDSTCSCANSSGCSQPSTSSDNRQGIFTGNLGIGVYVEREQLAFVDWDDSHGKASQLINNSNLPTPQRRHKSMVNLSSIDLLSINYPSTPSSPCEENLNHQSSISQLVDKSADLNIPLIKITDCGGVCVSKANYRSLPLLIRIIFFPNTLIDIDGSSEVGTVVNETPNPEAYNSQVQYPAWFIIEPEKINADTAYSFYRCADYLNELNAADDWLDSRLTNEKTSAKYECSTLDRRAFKHTYIDSFVKPRGLRSKNRNTSLSSSTTTTMTIPSIQVLQANEQQEESNIEQQELDIPQCKCDYQATVITQLDESKLSRISALVKQAIEVNKQMLNLMEEDQNAAEQMAKMSAIILRNSTSELDIPDSSRVLLPIDILTNKHHLIENWNRIQAEEVVEIAKVPNNSSDPPFTTELVDKFDWQNSTMLLSTNYLLFTKAPLTTNRISTTCIFLRLFPMNEIWCDTFKPAILSNQYTTNCIECHNAKMMKYAKHLESEIDQFKSCNISSSSGISTASFEDIQESHTSTATANSNIKYQHKTQPQSVRQHKQHQQLQRRQDKKLESDILLVGQSVTDSLAIRFTSQINCLKWKQLIQDATKKHHQIHEGKVISMKVVNELIESPVIYKYLTVTIDTTAQILKQRAIESLNITADSNLRAELYLGYADSSTNEKEILLRGPENIYLIALSSITDKLNKSQFMNPPQHANSVSPALTIPSVDLIPAFSATEEQKTLTPNEKDHLLPRGQVKVYCILRSPKLVRKCSQHTDYPASFNTMTKSAINFCHTSISKHHHPQHYSTTKVFGSKLRTARSANSLQSVVSCDLPITEIFGHRPVDLWPDCVLPQSLLNLFAIVYFAGVDIEGIFRKSAVVHKIEVMRLKVDKNEDPITLKDCPPILAACVLKRYFNEIPGHLLIDSKWDEWSKLTEVSTVEEKTKIMENLIRNLPTVNRVLLTMLIYLLIRICDNETINLMSSKNLASVWAPNLIQHENVLANVQDSITSVNIITNLLDPPIIQLIMKRENLQTDLHKLFLEIWSGLNEETNVESGTQTQILGDAQSKSDQCGNVVGENGSLDSTQPVSEVKQSDTSLVDGEDDSAPNLCGNTNTNKTISTKIYSTHESPAESDSMASENSSSVSSMMTSCSDVSEPNFKSHSNTSLYSLSSSSSSPINNHLTKDNKSVHTRLVLHNKPMYIPDLNFAQTKPMLLHTGSVNERVCNTNIGKKYFPNVPTLPDQLGLSKLMTPQVKAKNETDTFATIVNTSRQLRDKSCPPELHSSSSLACASEDASTGATSVTCTMTKWTETLGSFNNLTGYENIPPPLPPRMAQFRKISLPLHEAKVVHRGRQSITPPPSATKTKTNKRHTDNLVLMVDNQLQPNRICKHKHKCHSVKSNASHPTNTVKKGATYYRGEEVNHHLTHKYSLIDIRSNEQRRQSDAHTSCHNLNRQLNNTAVEIINLTKPISDATERKKTCDPCQSYHVEYRANLNAKPDDDSDDNNDADAGDVKTTQPTESRHKRPLYNAFGFIINRPGTEYLHYESLTQPQYSDVNYGRRKDSLFTPSEPNPHCHLHHQQQQQHKKKQTAVRHPDTMVIDLDTMGAVVDRSRPIRRISSHASTISSGSNTLVGTSNEHLS